MSVPLDLIALLVSAITGTVGAAASTEPSIKLFLAFFKAFGIDIDFPTSDTSSAQTSAVDFPLDTPILIRPKLHKAERHLTRRIDEARKQQRRNQYYAVVFRWSGRLLTFTQYIVGAVLATSFVKQEISPRLIGAAGVIVVVASGITQHFNPGIGAEVAAQKADQLEALIRETEDAMLVIETTNSSDDDDPQPILELLKKFSTEMTKIRATLQTSPRRTLSARRTTNA